MRSLVKIYASRPTGCILVIISVCTTSKCINRRFVPQNDANENGNCQVERTPIHALAKALHSIVIHCLRAQLWIWMFSRSDSAATAIFHTEIFCDQVSARLACTNKIAEIPLVKILFVTGITSIRLFCTSSSTYKVLIRRSETV